MLVIKTKLSEEHKRAQQELVDACFMVYIQYYLFKKTGNEEALNGFCQSLANVTLAASIHDTLNREAAKKIQETGEYEEIMTAMKAATDPLKS